MQCRQSLEDDPCPGRPVTITTSEMVNKTYTYDIVMTDRQVTERRTAIIVGISQEKIHSILTENLVQPDTRLLAFYQFRGTLSCS